jgi:hypothetical protein
MVRTRLGKSCDEAFSGVEFLSVEQRRRYSGAASNDQFGVLCACPCWGDRPMGFSAQEIIWVSGDRSDRI